MDSKTLIDKLVRAYNHAQRCLTPLFGLKPVLETRVDIVETDCVDLDYFYSGNYVGSDTLSRKEAENLDSFMLGYSVGLVLYDIRNPLTKQESLRRTKKQMEEFGKTGFNFADSDAETPLIVSKIISYCCAYNYRNFNESMSGNPLVESENAMIDFWKSMVVTNDPLPEALFGIFVLDHRSREIAQELYVKFGYRVIQELAPLPFLEAKERVIGKLGKDVFGE
jgi:hypothetical protein